MNKYTALIFGSSGLVGSELLKLTLEDENYSLVKIFVRKPLDIEHSKLQQIVINFEDVASYEKEVYGEHLYLCLGTTMAKAGSKAAFYKVDFTYSLGIATIASQNKVPNVALISSIGADEKSIFYYTKVKGQLETAIKSLPFLSAHVVRPSLLLGDRKENRLGERVATWVSVNLPWIYFGPLKKYVPISGTDVAKAILKYMCSEQIGYHIHNSVQLKQI